MGTPSLPRYKDWLDRASPYWGRLAGSLLGLVAWWYGAAAGFLLGSMVDAIRADRRLRTYLAHPEGLRLGTLRLREEPEGLCAAAVLALHSPWPGNPSFDQCRDFFVAAIQGSPGTRPRFPQGFLRFLEARQDEGLPPLEAFGRELAMARDPRARALLAQCAYALLGAVEGPKRLAFGQDKVAKGILIDCGVEAEVLARARESVFPDYRDPWEVLDLQPGADGRALKAAWRRASKDLHPDHGKDSDSAFLSAKAAYDYLLSELSQT